MRVSFRLLIAFFIAFLQFAPFMRHFLRAFQGRVLYLTDFPAYYFGATSFVNGISPYNESALAAFRAGFGADVLPFTYPPSSLPFFAPLALLSYNSALFWFQLLSFAALVVMIFTVLQIIEAEGRTASWGLVLIATLACFDAISSTITHGQVNVIATALIMLAWHSARMAKCDWRVAVFLAGATMLKTYPALLILGFIIKRDYRVVGWYFAIMSMAVVISLVTVPWTAWVEWLSNVLPTGRWGVHPFLQFSPADFGNRNLNGAISRIFSEATAQKLGTIVQGTSVAIVAILLYRLRQSHRYWDLAFGLVAVVTLLIVPISWPHHYVFLVPSLVASALIVADLGAFLPAAYVLASFVLIATPWEKIEDVKGTMGALIQTAPILGPIALTAFLMYASFTKFGTAPLPEALTAQ